MTPEQRRTVEAKVRNMRHHIVNMIGCKEGKVGHLGGSSSSAEIVGTLYFHRMNFDPKAPKAPHRDYFLLSKGHAALVQYAALVEHGVIAEEELCKVKTFGAMLQGHPDMTKCPWLEANTGSLGMGLSIGLGIALGVRQDNGPSRVYVIVGDGELAEGQIWEAAMAASHYKADNLVAIIDRNRLQATGTVRARMDSREPAKKFAAFGWNILEVDGHNVDAIDNALAKAETTKGKPTAIIANTIKGKFISFAEDQVAFHNGSLTPEQFEQAHKDINSYVYEGSV